MASPSDVVEERAAIRAVVDETNSLLASSDLRFRVAGWEHTLPAAGRPQGLINPGVDRCDMFIGLLKRRWGSATGEYSSGFEEEYTLAQARHDQSGSPSIHLFFAELPPTLLEDPGTNLKQVLAFKEKIISERIALFRSFVDPHDLARQVQSLLISKALQSLEETREAPDAGTSAGDEPSATAVPAVELDEAREQMSTALQSLTDIIRGKNQGGDLYDQDRVELIARAFGKDQDEIGSHFANRLFRRRGDFALSVGEAHLWLRSLLSDVGRHEPEDRTIPGWGALLEDPQLGQDKLVAMAASEQAAVSIGATRVMAERHLQPAALFGPEGELPEDGVAALAERWIAILNAQPGIGEALDYFLSSFDPTGDLADAVLEAATLNEKTTTLLSAVRSAITGDPGSLASDYGVVLSARRGNMQLRRILSQHLDDLPDEALVELVRRGDDLRLPALEIGLRRGILNAEQVEKAVNWEDVSLVERLVELAVEDAGTAQVLLGGKSRIGPERLRIELLARASGHDDLVAAHHAKPWDTETWAALLLNAGPEELAEARRLIDTAGTDLRESLQPLLEDRDDLIDFIVERQIGAAGICLARRLQVAADADADATSRLVDLKRVIEAERLSDRLQRLAFIREMAGAVRTESTEEMAIVRAWLEGLAGDIYSSERDALFDSPLAQTLAEIASAGDDATTRTSALRWRAAQSTTGDEELLELIYDDVSEVRMAAIANLIIRWDAQQLTELLDTYAERSKRYWYNIIVALDDHLYAPQPPATP